MGFEDGCWTRKEKEGPQSSGWPVYSGWMKFAIGRRKREVLGCWCESQRIGVSERDVYLPVDARNFYGVG